MVHFANLVGQRAPRPFRMLREGLRAGEEWHLHWGLGVWVSRGREACRPDRDVSTSQL